MAGVCLPATREIAFLALCLATASCTPAPAEPAAAALALAVRADVTGFFPDPPFAYEAFSIDVSRSLHEPLVALDRDFRLQPGLAEDWESPDDRTYRFRLRQAWFSDGRPVRASDVAASLQAAREVPWPTAAALAAIESVRVLDERRLEIRARGAGAALLPRLAWGFTVPAEQVGRPRPAGSGPYVLESWQPGSGFTLVRNPHHAGPAPHFGRVRFRVVPEERERLDLLLRGRVAAAGDVAPERVAELRGDARVAVHVQVGPRVLLLALRVDRAPFADPRLREALELSLDRGALARAVYTDVGEVSEQIVAPGVAGFCPGQRRPARDLARARELLARAAPGGLRVRLDTPNNRYLRDLELARAVARQAAEAGIEVEVAALDKVAFFRRIDAGASDLHLLGWSCNTGHGSEVLDSFLHSRAGGLGAYNSTGLADPELDALIEAAAQDGEPGRLRAALARAGELRAVLPLLLEPQIVAVSRRLHWEPPFNLALRPETLSPAE